MINTIVPIELKDLKKYFEDKTESYLIDYENSTLKGAQFLTYLSNLVKKKGSIEYNTALFILRIKKQLSRRPN